MGGKKQDIISSFCEKGIPCHGRHVRWYLALSIGSSYEVLPDLHTNVYMGLLPLKHCCHSTDAIAILGEYLLDRVYASPLAEGKLAGPDKRSESSRKSRHCEGPL